MPMGWVASRSFGHCASNRCGTKATTKRCGRRTYGKSFFRSRRRRFCECLALWPRRAFYGKCLFHRFGRFRKWRGQGGQERPLGGRRAGGPRGPWEVHVAVFLVQPEHIHATAFPVRCPCCGLRRKRGECGIYSNAETLPGQPGSLNAVAAKRAVGDSGAYRVGKWLGCDTPGTKKAFTGDGPLPEVFLAVVGARLTNPMNLLGFGNPSVCARSWRA